MELTRIDTIVQFTQGTASWNNVNTPVPAGVVVIDTENKIIKEGDGTTLLANLPVCLDYDFNSSTSGALTPEGDDVGKITIADDSMYKSSSINLADILTSITSKAAVDITQETRITDLTNQLGIIATVSEDVVDGTIVVCSNSQYIPGDRTLTQLIADLVAQASVAETGMHIADLEWYTDSGLTNKVVKPNEVSENSTYWCKITGFHDNAELSNVDFGLATLTQNIIITNDSNEQSCGIIAAVYGGSNYDYFQGVTVDNSNNIICVGYTNSEGTGSSAYSNALVVKFDSNLNIAARKIYGGDSNDYFYGVAVDSSDNIICVGTTFSEGTNGNNALVVKFDSSLNIAARKIYGGDSNDYFYGVAVDSSDNIICVGTTFSEGTNGSAMIVKFDSGLNIVVRKIYGGNNGDEFRVVTIDSSGNIICVGHTASEGSNTDALVIKFDSNLNILTRKIYGGSNGDIFYGVAIDNSDNIICAGYTNSEGTGSPTYSNALIVKFDSGLNIVVRKIYGGSNVDIFYSVIVDSFDNIICAGYTQSEGTGSYSALIVKFDSDLDVLSHKIYSGTGEDLFYGITIDNSNDIVCVGNTSSEGSGSVDALILKLPNNIPSGTHTGTILTNLTLTDSTLTLANSNLTLANSTLTLANSTLTLANSTLTLANSTIALEKDVIVAARYIDPTELITVVYSSAFVDEFKATAADSTGNIFAVGLTTMSGVQHALIVKFDSDFNTLARKLYSGQYSGNFNSAIVDSADNVIAVGQYITSEGGFTEAFIVKFTNDLGSIITHKTYGATGDDVFNDITLGASDNYYVAGYTTSEGTGLKEGLVVKFNSTLAILYKKRYGGTGNDVLYGITLDSIGNILCVGSTSSEGSNTSGLILKLDTNLNVVLRKYYNSTLGTTTEFKAVVNNASNITFVVGHVVIASGNKGLIVKYDSSLNIIGNKVYGNSLGSTEFTGVDLDSTGNIFIAGKTNAEGAGNYDAVVLKMNNTLNIQGRKTYGTIGEDANIDCSVVDDDVVLSGYSVIKGSTDAVITKLPNSLPDGTYTNKFITDLILNDSKLTLSDDNGTTMSSTLTMADSSLVLTNGIMHLENATGAIVKDVTIMDAVSNVFRVQFGDIVSSGSSVTVPFIVTTNDGIENLNKTISIDVTPKNIIAAVYGDNTTNADYFRGTVVDNSNNIICVGRTDINNGSAIVVKLDSNFNITASKLYGGTNSDEEFSSVVIDLDNNVICSGYTTSEGSGLINALIVKFDNDLNLISSKTYGGSSDDRVNGITTDSNNNIICVGWSTSEVSNRYAIIVKFDSSLNIVARKIYGGSGTDQFQSVTTDSSDNIICVGSTNSEGSDTDALIVKFDSGLNIVVRKIYGGSNVDIFYGVAVDNSDNIICVGSTNSEGTNGSALIVKFDSGLNIVARKIYGGSNVDEFKSVTTDSSDNIICVGYTKSEGSGSYDALIVKFDSSLNTVARKIYGGSSTDYFFGISIDNADNIICVGSTNSEGSSIPSYSNCLIIKLPKDISFGTLTGTVLTGLTLADSNLTLANSALTLANSTLTLINSSLTLANINLTLTNSIMTLEKDTIVL